MLQRNGEDIASKSVFNEANLKEHLRGKTADELIEELEKLYDEEELTGEEFDPRIVEIYIEAMEKVSPPDPAAERAFDRSWALFHTKHRVEKEPSSSHRAVKIRWRIEAAVLIVISYAYPLQHLVGRIILLHGKMNCLEQCRTYQGLWNLRNRMCLAIVH